ncbi:GMP/IMP nucleotidase [Marinibactrum halimedae]|nr:GMP/IMP nucleotidase [Marinibactrum halimedae]MCD9460461.1 GMP/IMP nucleotidase [Marinibactrum halimedae]
MINWDNIDTVLLDMDGTLLDLHYDNFFWLEYLPKRYAHIHNVSLEEARECLMQHIRSHEGTLNWYCLEFWSEALRLNVRSIKEEVKHKIRVRPYVEEFLQALNQADKKSVLITNAHPQSLELKLEVTHIDRWLDVVISSHEFQQPKEAQAFWYALQDIEQFDPERTLFIDDTLRVLDSAKCYGIQHLLCVHQPDSQSSRIIAEYPAIRHFDEIMPGKMTERGCQ